MLISMRRYTERFICFWKSFLPLSFSAMPGTWSMLFVQELSLLFDKQNAQFFCSDSRNYNSHNTIQRNTQLWWCQCLVFSHSWDLEENHFLGMYGICRWLAFIAASCISKYFPLWGSGWNGQCDHNASYKKIKVAMLCNSIIHWIVAGAHWKKMFMQYIRH